MGLTDRSPDDNSGGIVRNNFIYRNAGVDGDVGILVADSAGTQVLHNTVLLNGTYPNAIEYRFGGTSNVLIANNLTSARDSGARWGERHGQLELPAGDVVDVRECRRRRPAPGGVGQARRSTRSALQPNAPSDWDDRGASGRRQRRLRCRRIRWRQQRAGPAGPPTPTNQPPSVSLTSPASGTAYTAPTTVPLSAQASDNDGAVASVSFYSGATLLGSATISPYTFSWSNVQAGSYTLTAVAVDNGGAVDDLISGERHGDRRRRWWRRPAGAVGHRLISGRPRLLAVRPMPTAPSRCRVAGPTSGRLRTSSGLSISRSTGDGEIIARVAALSEPHDWAKAGVMIRADLTASSSHAFAFVSGGNGVAFQHRVGDGGPDYERGVFTGAPYWLRLVRSGSTFSAYQSADGSAWELIASTSLPMGTTVYAGLALTSHDGSASASASFTDVTVSNGTSVPPPTPPPPTPPPPTPPPPTPPPATLTLLFTPSVDHASNVTSYTAEVFAAGADPTSASPVASQNLGKPAVVSNSISVNLLPLVSSLAPGSYFVSVSAVGPGGSTRGASSNTFVR